MSIEQVGDFIKVISVPDYTQPNLEYLIRISNIRRVNYDGRHETVTIIQFNDDEDVIIDLFKSNQEYTPTVFQQFKRDLEFILATNATCEDDDTTND